MFWQFFLICVLLALGLFLLIKGADWFVDGSSGLAKGMHVPPLVIGLTIVSIGTSMPEFSVSLTSSILGFNDMSFGNIIGSNIFNTFVVIGASALFVPFVATKEMKKYDIPILIGIYLLLTLFSFVISPNVIEVFESIILFSITFAYTAFLILRSRKEIKKEKELNKDNKISKKTWIKNIVFTILGLAGIVLGGDLVVDNASKFAQLLGMSELLVGLTIVAVGTSLPELVTSIVAARKGENDIAIGNAIGSCLFNVVLILGLCSTIAPAKIADGSLFDLIVMLFSAVLILIFIFRKSIIKRWQGIVMILLYVAYLAYIVLRELSIF